MDIQNRKLFRLTRFVLLKLPAFFRFLAKFRKTKKRLLLIKTDAIGDYILFRNFIEILKRSEKYKDYQIDLLGNTIWRDLTETYDSQFLNAAYFINPRSFYEAPLKTLKQGWQLFTNNYEVVLQPTYTRLFITDGFAALTAAKQIIGYESDNEGIVPRYKKKTDKFYTQLLPLPADSYFEFNRNVHFFQTVLGEKIYLTSPQIKTDAVAKNGIAILPGAGAFKRGWENDKFLQLIKRLLQQTKQPVYLIGGPAEVKAGDYIMQNLPAGSIDNRINKTSLPQLIELIGGSGLLIANETSAIHMAVATQTPSVCILGGGHFERFAPYPAGTANAPICIYDKMPCYHCNWLCIYKTESHDPFPCISNVGLENVWQATLPLLTS
ncbi:glycosyltransferase family 9 protein [Mucilaginibacter corticis]|uniref:Glycosyltransferase family 9 protein n=1 Tax=Mucilaginibacter corticis TaxID=2597670 RepID=A0A556MWE2_9SPHI|nr:glycosyltransferase family 9 protein [Mucilaginibacter corticis]TSJ44250.1 glycosyltransferase family 9 protein [Mucilaginibacter corticis]